MIDIDTILAKIGSSQDGDVCITAASELAVEGLRRHDSNLARGSASAPADSILDADQSEDLARLIETSTGELRRKLLFALAYVGGGFDLATIERVAKTETDIDTISTLIFCAGQIGGPQAINWLKQLKEASHDEMQRLWVESALTKIETGGIADCSEGLVNS